MSHSHIWGWMIWNYPDSNILLGFSSHQSVRKNWNSLVRSIRSFTRLDEFGRGCVYKTLISRNLSWKYITFAENLEKPCARSNINFPRADKTELKDEKELRFSHPPFRSPEAHAKWGLYQMLEYMGLHESLQLGLGDGRNRTRVHIDI